MASSPAPRPPNAAAPGWTGRHRWNRDLVLVLLRYAPEPDVAHALDQLPAGQLHHLARLLAQVTDLHQIAGAIASDLDQRSDGRPAGLPSGQPGPSPGQLDGLVAPDVRRWHSHEPALVGRHTGPE